jgi:predicted ferric reductase
MARSWQSLSEEQARTHPFYGVGGWLYVLVVHLALGLALNIALPVLHPAGFRASFPSSGALLLWLIYVVLAGGGLLVIVRMMRIRHPDFRHLATVILVAAALAALAAFLALEGSAVGENLFRWAVYAAVWVAYVHRSVRVRLTFEHATNSDDPFLDGLQEEPRGR